MADEYEVPELPTYIEIPDINEGIMEGEGPFKSSEEFQVPLGFPGEKVENWKEKAIDKMADLKSKYRSVQVFLDMCVKCGACTDKCHYFLGTSDPKNMPVARQDLFRSVYRRYFTFSGKYFPKLVGAKELDDEMLDDWYNYYHQCSQCRRCSVFCPYGIDTAEISMAAREVLDVVGVGQKYCNQILGKAVTVGNNLGLPEPALKDTLIDLEEEVEEDTGVPIKYPLDQKGSEILLVTPSADFFAEPHIDGLIGYGKVFHQDGVTWTLSSYASEAANFGMFIGSYDVMRKAALRIRKAALDLEVSRIIVGECGHAWRVAYSFWNTLSGVGSGAPKGNRNRRTSSNCGLSGKILFAAICTTGPTDGNTFNAMFADLIGAANCADKPSSWILLLTTVPATAPAPTPRSPAPRIPRPVRPRMVWPARPPAAPMMIGAIPGRNG